VDGGALSVIPYFHYLAASLAGSLFQSSIAQDIELNLFYVGDEMLYWVLNAYHLNRKGSHRVNMRPSRHTQEPDDIKRKEQNSHQ
jgi:hypothetical protein